MSTVTQKKQEAVYRIMIDALQSLGHTSEWVEEQVDALVAHVAENPDNGEDEDA